MAPLRPGLAPPRAHASAMAGAPSLLPAAPPRPALRPAPRPRRLPATPPRGVRARATKERDGLSLEDIGEELAGNAVYQSRFVRQEIPDDLGEERPLVLSAAPFVVGLTVGGAVCLFEEATNAVRGTLLDSFVPEAFGATREEMIQLFGTIDEYTPLASALPIAVLPLFGGAAVALMRAALSNDFGLSLKEVNGDIKRTKDVSLPRVITKSAASVLTLGTGNALGPEGPVVELGGMLSSVLYRDQKLQEAELRLVLAGGCAAGLATGFNAPVSAIFFALESILSSTRDKKAVSFILLSAVTAALLKELTIGLEPKFAIPQYNLHGIIELPWFLLLGVGCGVGAFVFKEANEASGKMFADSAVPAAARPLLGSLFVVGTALVLPQVLFFGYFGVDNALQGVPPSAEAALVLLSLAGGKIAVTSVCQGSGLVGGVFAPSLFIGATLGSSFGTLLNLLPLGVNEWNVVAGSPAYALVGMASLLAATVNAPLTSVLLLFELTRDYEAILPVMAGVAASTITENWLRKTLKDSETQGLGMPKWTASCDLDAMRAIKVRDALYTNVVQLGGSEALFAAAEEMLLYQVSLPAAYTCDGAVVRDKNNKVMGCISSRDLMSAVRDVEGELRVIYKNLGGEERGGIIYDDLKSVFKTLDMDVAEDVLRELFATIDTDGSGIIDFDEFVRGASILGVKGTNRALVDVFGNLDEGTVDVISASASLYDAVDLMSSTIPAASNQRTMSLAVVEKTYAEAEAEGLDMSTFKEKVLGIVTEESVRVVCDQSAVSRSISLEL